MTAPSTDNNRTDLAPGAGPRTGGLIGNLVVVPDMIIAIAIGGAGYGSIAGNDAANHLSGGGGNDWQYGRAGTDTSDSGPGTDRLHGGVGGDRFMFAPGTGPGVADVTSHATPAFD